MRKTKSVNFNDKKKFALLVDGDCEFWYFQMLKRNNRGLRVDLKPEIPQKKKLSEQYKKVLEYANIYDKVIWIVDLDVILSETRKAKKGDVTALQEFEKYLNTLKDNENVMVIINNPCLEFWLLLHFEPTSKFFNDCESAERQLKKHLHGYVKTERFYTSHGNDIYLKLKPRLKAAIKNAKRLKSFSFTNTQTGLSEMHEFFDMKEMQMLL